MFVCVKVKAKLSTSAKDVVQDDPTRPELNLSNVRAFNLSRVCSKRYKSLCDLALTVGIFAMLCFILKIE